MKTGTKCLALVWALLLLGLWVPESAFSGVCSDLTFYCCESYLDCGTGACLPYGGICTGSDMSGGDDTPCNTDDDCPEGNSCVSMGVCEGETFAPCTNEQVGMCSGIAGNLCQTDAHCTPPEYCIIMGSCSDDGTDCSLDQNQFKFCTDWSGFCTSDDDCTLPATCEIAKTCFQGADTCTGVCFTDADCVSQGGGTCTGDPFCCEGVCGGNYDFCGGAACDTTECEAPIACGVCSDIMSPEFDSCREHTDCDSGEFCLSLGTCVGGSNEGWFCTNAEIGMCMDSEGNLDSNTLCRNDADCPQSNSCAIVGSCANNVGMMCLRNIDYKACTDSMIFCSADEDCTAPATCEVVKTCFQGADTCTGVCFTDADCVSQGGGTCTGDPFCCEGVCDEYEWCPEGACEEPCTYEYVEPTTPADPVVETPDGTTITFGEVTSEGETTVEKSLETPGVPGNFSLLSEPTFVYDIQTTAGFNPNPDPPNPPILVCITYDEPEPPIDENSIRLLHEEGGTFVDRTVSLDTENNVVCAEVSDLSDFVVAYESGCTDPVDCDDSNACTVDDCIDNQCQYSPVNCDDNNPCTEDTCDTVSGCENTCQVGQSCAIPGGMCQPEAQGQCAEAADQCVCEALP